MIVLFLCLCNYCSQCDLKSCGATYSGVTGLALPPPLALEATMATADQALAQRKQVEAPAALLPTAVCATSSCPVDPLWRPS